MQTAYPPPANCPAVAVPKVNGEIWHRLTQRANKPMKFRDSRLASVQHSIVGSSLALIQIMDAISSLSKADAEPLDLKGKG